MSSASRLTTDSGVDSGVRATVVRQHRRNRHRPKSPHGTPPRRSLPSLLVTGPIYSVAMSIDPAYQTPSGLTEHIRATLAGESNCVLGTANPGGAPHMTEVLFSLNSSDKIVIPTPDNTRKIKNVLARPQATFFVSHGSGWISCTGTARVIAGVEASEINLAIRDRLLTESGAATIGLVLGEHENATIEITPTKWLSWSSDRFMTAVAGTGADLDAHPPSTWFRDLS